MKIKLRLLISTIHFQHVLGIKITDIISHFIKILVTQFKVGMHWAALPICSFAISQAKSQNIKGAKIPLHQVYMTLPALEFEIGGAINYITPDLTIGYLKVQPG